MSVNFEQNRRQAKMVDIHGPLQEIVEIGGVSHRTSEKKPYDARFVILKCGHTIISCTRNPKVGDRVMCKGCRDKDRG